MPTYEYQCTQCGARFERFQSMSADPIKSCPECGAPIQRLIGAGAGIMFKTSPAPSGHRSHSCTRETPCCGRETPCERSPCESS